MSNRTLTLDDRTYEYLLAHSLREDPRLARLRAETASHPQVNMQIAPEQGQFMALLVRLLGQDQLDLHDPIEKTRQLPTLLLGVGTDRVGDLQVPPGDLDSHRDGVLSACPQVIIRAGRECTRADRFHQFP